ncbi:putative glycosyltransferase (GT4) [Formosa agariphila KMM 3901]|uniref:Putative glycosyltransferase (GT4) n=1 Tax=Formosa agariphila (strain DSM 15362 / KCTC 12365 / LMG 23005 / KMM 3901 / M-2Alg 35-1) TaxID=1347342 RepID=T2KK42_FORAG|nr:glycosyltransferase family 4 protein [Formosa agariphila]CDF79135.1 putative glycosyltransferase (GT4) [Formosa agariphila KMM 3901]
MKKNVLIVTYYWPPAGGPGVQRWLKFVKYLPEFNINPIVYIPENANYPLLDQSLIHEISPDITILKSPISEPYKFARLLSGKKANTISKGIITETGKQSKMEQLMLYIRGNFFIPDARKSWVKPSVALLNNYITEHNIETVITTGPPHSLHLIGLKLKKHLNIKWIADFRDPWTTIGYHKELKLTKSSQAKHKQLESEVLNSADAVIVTSNPTKTEFEALTSKPIHVITNGYDTVKTEAITIDEKFTLAHIGSLLSKRNPKVLWRVLSDLVKARTEFAQDFQLNIIGSIGEDVLQSIEKSGLSTYVNNVGYVSHEEAIKYQKQSQILLLIEIDSEDTKCIIPGKLFEYMVSNRPILAMGPEDSDVETIIKNTNTGQYFLYNDYNGLKKEILKYYEAFQNGNLQTYPIGLQKYSRRSLTESLSKIL